MYFTFTYAQMPYESKGEPVVHDQVPLPGKTKLLLFRILKIYFFSGISSGLILLGFGSVLLFFLSKHTFLCIFLPQAGAGGVQLWYDRNIDLN